MTISRLGWARARFPGKLRWRVEILGVEGEVQLAQPPALAPFAQVDRRRTLAVAAWTDPLAGSRGMLSMTSQVMAPRAKGRRNRSGGPHWDGLAPDKAASTASPAPGDAAVYRPQRRTEAAAIG